MENTEFHSDEEREDVRTNTEVPETVERVVETARQAVDKIEVEADRIVKRRAKALLEKVNAGEASEEEVTRLGALKAKAFKQATINYLQPYAQEIIRPRLSDWHYWADKVVTGVVTVGLGFGAVAAATAITRRSATKGGTDTASPFGADTTGFSASERPSKRKHEGISAVN